MNFVGNTGEGGDDLGLGFRREGSLDGKTLGIGPTERVSAFGFFATTNGI